LFVVSVLFLLVASLHSSFRTWVLRGGLKAHAMPARLAS
jgi:hypothetical protein